MDSYGVNDVALATSWSFTHSPHREAVCSWLRRHGIDPTAMPVENLITRRVEERQVCVVLAQHTSEGRWRIDANGDPMVETVLVQLESPPQPFPAELWER